MQMILQTKDLASYLKSSDIIDFDNAADNGIRDFADKIEGYSKNKIDYIKNAYEYVRDKISHSADIEGKIVTCKASDVLKTGEGICFAKSHLLAALLRCKGIAAGFCYQKLILDDDNAPYIILHGLNAVYMEEPQTWIRLDARGNKAGVNAQFSLTDEKLAFPVRAEKGEEDIPVIFASPDQNVVWALENHETFHQLWADLPAKLATE
jgi:Transglutaminase-like enzymes, putative cysteine proteases